MTVNGLGYGLDYWGVGPWGILPPTGTFSLASVFAASERTVRVTFTDPALVGTSFKIGAALNLATWNVTIVGDPTDLILLAVRQVDDAARQFELYFLRKLPRFPAQLLLQCPTVLSASGGPLIGISNAQFDGAAKPLVTKKNNRSEVADIRSVQVPGSELAGILQQTSAGDYQVESGDELLRKMILRRLTTKAGAFAFIPKERFGLGLTPKSNLRGAKLNEMREVVEREVRKEPDVADVRAQVSYSFATNVLTIALRVRRVSTGQDVEVNVQIPPDSGVVL